MSGMADAETATQPAGTAASRTFAVALALLLASLVLAVVSLVVGAAPLVVEPGDAADPIECGGSWNRAAGLHDACYTTFDVWAALARAGLVGAAVLAGFGVVLLLRSRSTRSG
jgi:hypothetical protein